MSNRLELSSEVIQLRMTGQPIPDLIKRIVIRKIVFHNGYNIVEGCKEDDVIQMIKETLKN